MPIEYTPKQKNRFILEFENEEVNIDSWLVSKVDKPSYCFLSKKWDDVIIELIDVIGPSTTEKVYEQILLKSKDSGFNDYKIRIDSLDPVGVTVETWKMSGRFLNINFGTGDYSKDEVSKIRMRFEVNRCFLLLKRHLITERCDFMDK